MNNRLDGQIAIVTGAGRGFGQAIALGLAAEGALVTVTSRNKEQLEQTVSLIEAAGGTGLAIAGDVTIQEDVTRIVSTTHDQFGATTLLVNNAGVPDPFGPVSAIDPDKWWQAQEVHIRGPLLYMNAVLPAMLASGTGRVINVSAKGGYLVAPNLSAYCVGKAAQIRLTELVAAETRDQGISIFAIDPGFVITELAVSTMNSPDAQRWLPDMVKRLQERKQDEDTDADLGRCAQLCADLASGKYDLLSGRYMELDDDLEIMVLDAECD